MRHIYKFHSINGSKSELTFSSELTPDLLTKYEDLLGLDSKHSIESTDNNLIELAHAMPLLALAKQVIRGSYTPGVEDAALLERCGQMTARVARFEASTGWLKEYREGLLNLGSTLDPRSQQTLDVLNETPAQSLNAIKADALEEAAAQVRCWGESLKPVSVAAGLEELAYRLVNPSLNRPVECDQECWKVMHMTGGNHRTDCAAGKWDEEQAAALREGKDDA